MFSFGMSVVALSKIAFLGWGVEIQSIGFKALSGHAFRATVVLPVFFFITLQDIPAQWRTLGFLFGAALSMLVGILLINFNFHSVSEVVASCIFGAFIDVVFIWLAKELSQAHGNLWAIPASVIAFFVIHGLKPSSINHRLVDIALYFSGRDYPYRW